MTDIVNDSNRHKIGVRKELRTEIPIYQWYYFTVWFQLVETYFSLHVFQLWLKPVLAEFIATFMLLFWACMLQPKPEMELNGMYQLLPALSAGIALIIIITIFWDICIIQFNPSVTISLVLAEALPG